MNNELKAPYAVVIVGSGYSGTMVAVHLARAQRGLRAALIDRSKTFGRGVAYGTTDPKHLLNVPADHMGAFRSLLPMVEGASGESGGGRNPCARTVLRTGRTGAPDLCLSENMNVNHKQL
jgi:choline dehydrogenase-like flavoprotein